MDSFKQIWGSAEGCSSSESGWTMYIASPMQEDDAGCSNENDGYHDIYGENRRKKQGAKVDEEESDDSMASDASSGPVHYHHAYGHSQTTHGTATSEILLMITYAKVVLSWFREETRNMTQEKWPGGS